MKFFATTLFAAGAVASITKRQSGGIDGLVSDIKAITTATGTLGDSINSFASVSDAAGIISNVQAVSDAINKGVSDAGATSTLSVADASELISPVQDLQAAVSSAVDAAIGKQDAFNSNGLCGEVQNQLSTLQSGGQSLADGLTAIVPDTLKDTANQLSAPILADLKKAADAYANCPASSSSSGSTGPTSSASASSSSSDAAPTSTGSSPAGYSSSSASASSSASGSVPPVSSATKTSSGGASTTSSPAVYTGAASAFGPAFGLAAAGLAVLAL